MAEEEEQEGRTVQDVFNELDDDKDGRINAKQLEKLLPQCIDMKDCDENICNELIAQVPNENMTIDYEGFINLLTALQNQQQENEEEEMEEDQNEEMVFFLFICLYMLEFCRTKRF